MTPVRTAAVGGGSSWAAAPRPKKIEILFHNQIIQSIMNTYGDCGTCGSKDVALIECSWCEDDCCERCCGADCEADNLMCAKCDNCRMVEDHQVEKGVCLMSQFEDGCRNACGGGNDPELCTACDAVWEWSRRRNGYITSCDIEAVRPADPKKYIIKLKGGKIVSKTAIHRLFSENSDEEN